MKYVPSTWVKNQAAIYKAYGRGSGGGMRRRCGFDVPESGVPHAWRDIEGSLSYKQKTRRSPWLVVKKSMLH